MGHGQGNRADRAADLDWLAVSDAPLRLDLGGYTVDIVRRPDGGINLTAYYLFSDITVPVPAEQWRRIVEYAPPPVDIS